MSAETLAEWLICPVCAQPLAAVSGSVLGCVNGHRHDINRRGYATLLGPRSRVVGDTGPMLDARARVLEQGTYAPIVAAIDSALSSDHRLNRVVDAGTGTGYYLRSLLATRPHTRGLAMDLSPAAVARAVRNAHNIDGLVADTWQPLPIRDGVSDVILNIFAPRNPPEFHRILGPGGLLVVVVPRAEHLRELRTQGRMLDVPADKAVTLIESARALFALESSTEVVFDIDYDLALAESLIAMGPSAHHDPLGGADIRSDAAPIRDQPRHSTVTAAVDVVVLRRR